MLWCGHESGVFIDATFKTNEKKVCNYGGVLNEKKVCHCGGALNVNNVCADFVIPTT